MTLSTVTCDVRANPKYPVAGAGAVGEPTYGRGVVFLDESGIR